VGTRRKGTDHGGTITPHAVVTVPEFANITDKVLWLYADDPTIVKSGTNVLVWPDHSGLGHDASQATSSLQPTLSATGFGTNSKPYILFDASDDYLAIADHADLEFGSGTFAIFMALRYVSGTGAFKVAIAKGSDTAGSGWRCFRDSTDHPHLYYDAFSNYAASALTLADGTDSAIQWGVDALASVSLYAKTTSRARAAITVGAIPNTSNSVIIGQDNTPSYHANIRVAEIIIYKRAASLGFSDVETQGVMNYLVNKYGI
jgi:hypothetical protein